MGVRRACARQFYAGASPATIESYVAGFEPPGLPAAPVGGVVPHAGWSFSGRTAARVFFTLKRRGAAPSCIVLLGAVHRLGLPGPAVFSCGAWETPLGPVPVDEALASELLAAGIGLADAPEAHDGEHSIEVAVPFVRHFFPEASILPVACPPCAGAAAFGADLGRALGRRPVVVVASTDLTHYGMGYGFAPASGGDALEFVRENDARMLRLVAELAAESIVAEARRHANACGSGALAAAVAAARERGANRGVLVEYRTSHDSMPEEPVRRVVGYGGMALA